MVQPLERYGRKFIEEGYPLGEKIVEISQLLDLQGAPDYFMEKSVTGRISRRGSKQASNSTDGFETPLLHRPFLVSEQLFLPDSTPLPPMGVASTAIYKFFQPRLFQPVEAEEATLAIFGDKDKTRLSHDLLRLNGILKKRGHAIVNLLEKYYPALYCFISTDDRGLGELNELRDRVRGVLSIEEISTLTSKLNGLLEENKKGAIVLDSEVLSFGELEKRVLYSLLYLKPEEGLSAEALYQIVYETKNLKNWRRNNLSNLVKEVNIELKKVGKRIKFVKARYILIDLKAKNNGFIPENGRVSEDEIAEHLLATEVEGMKKFIMTSIIYTLASVISDKEKGLDKFIKDPLLLLKLCTPSYESPDIKGPEPRIRGLFGEASQEAAKNFIRQYFPLVLYEILNKRDSAQGREIPIQQAFNKIGLSSKEVVSQVFTHFSINGQEEPSKNSVILYERSKSGILY